MNTDITLKEHQKNAIARGLYGVCFILYPIHGKVQQQMIVELADKRAERIAEQEAINHSAKSE